jgi:hypothetical protein
MRTVGEIAITDVFLVFLHAAIVYAFYTGGKNLFLRILDKQTGRHRISNAEGRALFYWFICSLLLSTLLFFTRGMDKDAIIFALKTFFVSFFSSFLGIYMTVMSEKNKT